MADEVLARSVLEFTFDGSEAVDGAGRLEAAIARTEGTVVRSSVRMADVLTSVGDGAARGAAGTDRATKQLIGSIERTIAASTAGARGTTAFFESLAKQRGANLDALKPFLDQLAKVKESQEAVARAAQESAEKQRSAAAVVAENRRAFEQDSAAREAYLARLREEVKLLGMSEAAQRSYRAALANRTAGGGTEGEALLQQLERLRNAQERAARAAATQKGNDDFIKSLQRQSDAIGKTRADLLEMEAAQRGLTTQAAPMIAALRAQEKAIYGLSHASRDGRVSANQMKAAMSQLPAQFTDIFTSLAGGQNPFLVLIQQGGQIKDSFGGIGNAARALAGLIKPLYVGFGLLGGAAAAVAYGYKAGAEESDEFVRTIVLTGNAAGLTVGQLQEMSKEVASAGGTQGKAAEVLTRFAASAKVGAAELVKVSEAAIGLERVGGPAAEKTAEKFEALAKNPAQAAAALNEQTNFLTASIYQQIKALEDQGRTSEAAALAQSRFADVLASRRVELEANLGSIERGWLKIKDAIKGAADALLNIGRVTTIEEQIKTGRAALERLPSGNRDPLGIYTKQREAIEAQLVLLTKASFREAERADQVRIRNEAEKAGIDLMQRGDAMLDKAAKKAREIAEVRNLAAKSRLGDGPGVSADEEKILIDAIIKKYEEKGSKAVSAEEKLIEAGRRLHETLELQAAGLSGSFMKDWESLGAAYKAGAISIDQLEESQRRLIAGQPFAIKQAKEEADIREAVAKAALEQAKAVQAARNAEGAGIDNYLKKLKDDAQQRIDSLNDRLKAIQAEADATALARNQNIDLAAAVELVTAKRLEDQLVFTTAGSESARLLAEEIALRKELAAQLESSSIGKAVDSFLDPSRAKSFGDALTAAFDGAGNALVKLSNTLGDYASKQRNLQDLLSRNANDQEISPEERIRRENVLIQQQGELQIATYASMAGAAKGFFEEGSRGYKALEAAETAFRAFQLASDLVKGISAAAVGVATQAQGDPYTAFPRMAAMAAAMAALGFATGFFGKSSSGGQATAAQRQGGAATGRIVTPDQANREKADFRGGSVFGDDEARSESIAKSIDLLEDHARLELDYSRNSLSALEAIRDSMAGVANLVVRTAGGGLTSGKNFGVQTGRLSVNEGDPILKAFGFNDSGIIQGLANSGSILGKIGVFAQSLWGKVTQKIADSGLEVSGTIADLLVRQFIDVEKTTSSFFGLRKKTTTETLFGEEKDTQLLADQFGLIFTAIGDTIKSSAEVLGREGGAALAEAIASFPVAIERLSLKDLKGDELQEAISAAIGAQADTIAQALVPGLEAFQVVGEGYFETLIRVSSGIEVANYQLELLGITAVDYTDVLQKQGDVGAEIVRQSIVAAETAGGALSSIGTIVNTLSGTAEELAETYTALVDVRDALKLVGASGEALTVQLIRGAGGLDNLATSLDTYFTEFFTEQEQLAGRTSALVEQFTALGVAVPTSREQFRELVQQLIAGGDATAALAAKVLGLAGAFDEIADRRDEINSTRGDLEIELLRAQGRELEAVQRERLLELEALAKLDPALVSLKQAIYEATDAAVAGQKIRDLFNGLDSIAPDFLAGGDLIDFKARRLADELGFAGFGDIPIDRLLGSTKEEFRAFWESLGTEGKAALQELYPMFKDLWDTIRDENISDLIEGVAGSADELLAAYYEINPAADSLVEAWRKNSSEIGKLNDALAELEKAKPADAIDRMIADLQEAVRKRDGLQDLIASNRDMALDILASQGTQQGVDALKTREAELWKEFARTQDPAVAQALTKITLDRIRLEGTVAQKALQKEYDERYKKELAAFELAQQTITLEEQLRENQKDALREQIEGYKRLKEAASQLPEFLGGLRAGNLSNLSFTGRLEQQRTLFERSLETGNDPQGQLTAYLQQAQQLYGGATKTYSDLFTAALAKYEAAIAGADEKVDPQLAAAQSQLNALEALVEKAPELQQAVVDTSQAEVDAITSLNGSFGQGLATVNGTIADLKTVMETKLTELAGLNATMTDRITLLGQAVLDLREPIRETAANTRDVAINLEDNSLRVSSA